MGRIRKLKNREGLYVEFWDPAAGRTRRVRVHGTRAEAVRLLHEAEHQADRARLGLDADAQASNDVDVAEIAVAWRDYCRGRVRPNTWRGYAQGLKDTLEYLAPRGAPLRVRDLRPAQMEAYKAAALARGLDAHALAAYAGALKRMLAWAAREGRIASNPLAAWRPPRGEPAIPREPVTDWELAKLLEASLPPLGDVWVVMTATGLRTGEMTRLEWQDVDLAARRLRVRTGPGRKSRRERWIPFGDTVAEILTRERLHVAERPQTEAAKRLVCASPKGCAWGECLRAVFKTAVRRAGLRESLTLHCLRHTTATRMLAAGVDLKTAASILGHASVKLTADTYAHLVEANATSAAARLDEAVKGVWTARQTRAVAVGQ